MAAKRKQKPTNKAKSTKQLREFINRGGRSGAKSDFFKVLKKAVKTK